MDVMQKDRLARAGDYSDEAAGRRLAAAIRITGLSITDFAELSGQQRTAISNSIAGRSFPSRLSMTTLYRQFRVDPAFIMFGDYGHLPADVQTRIFAALADVPNGLDRRAG